MSKILLKEIRPECIGIPPTILVNPQEKEDASEILKFIKEKINDCETALEKADRVRVCKEMFDYIIDREIFRNSRFNGSLKFRATVWNKLVEFQHTTIPGPNDPAIWIPIAAEKLSFLNNVCHSTGKTSVTEWNVIP